MILVLSWLGSEYRGLHGDCEISFLGLPINTSLSDWPIRDSLVSKLKGLCDKVGSLQITSSQKLTVYNRAIVQRLTWLLSLSDLPVSFIERQLKPVATKYLKKWSGLARTADTSRLYLSKRLQGLHCCSLSTTFKKLPSLKTSTTNSI